MLGGLMEAGSAQGRSGAARGVGGCFGVSPQQPWWELCLLPAPLLLPYLTCSRSVLVLLDPGEQLPHEGPRQGGGPQKPLLGLTVPCLGSDQQTQAVTGMHCGQGAKGGDREPREGTGPLVVPLSSAGAVGDWLEMGTRESGGQNKVICGISQGFL